MPVTTSSQGEDIVSLHDRHDVIVALEPVVATGVDPADVMATVGRATFVGNNTNELVVSSVKAHAMRFVQQLIVFLNFFGFHRSLSSGADELRLGVVFALLLISVLHLDITLLILLFDLQLAFKNLGIFFSPQLLIVLSAEVEALLQLICAELEQVEHLGETDVSQDLGFTGLGASSRALLFPVEANELDAQVLRLQERKGQRVRIKLLTSLLILETLW